MAKKMPRGLVALSSSAVAAIYLAGFVYTQGADAGLVSVATSVPTTATASPSRDLPVLGVSSLEAIAQESGAARVVACVDARMREVYYAALEKDGMPQRPRWREVISTRCIAPQAAPRPPGHDWLGAGNGFAVYGNLGLSNVLPEVHPTALAIAQLAAPRLAAGEGVDAAAAAPMYVRDKVAFTREELASR